MFLAGYRMDSGVFSWCSVDQAALRKDFWQVTAYRKKAHLHLYHVILSVFVININQPVSSLSFSRAIRQICLGNYMERLASTVLPIDHVQPFFTLCLWCMQWPSEKRIRLNELTDKDNCCLWKGWFMFKNYVFMQQKTPLSANVNTGAFFTSNFNIA